MESRWYKRGVTLIEVMIVISIIALLVSITLVAAEVVNRHGKEEVTRGNFLLVETALEDYHEFYGWYPTDGSDLYTELSKVASSRKLLRNSGGSMIKTVNGQPVICDGWGTELEYIKGQTFPELISAGPDRKFGTPDDISSKRQ